MRRLASVVALVVLLALLASAHAQAAPGDELVDLDGDGDIDDADRAALEAAEVISIEDKSEATKLSESARAVTVVKLDKARERAADLGEVLARAHGIAVRRTGGLGSATRFSLNGLYDEQIRFLIDGVPLELAGWSLGVANVPVELVQRVEVYRGVVPIALGADALGGAIDLVSDPSWTDRAAISYQLGSFGTHRATLGARARDAATGLALGVTAFVDRARNDYAVEADVVDDVGRPTPTSVRRFHDGYTAGGAIVEAGLVQRGPIARALVRAFHNQYDKELQHNPTMKVPYGDASYAGETRGLAADLELSGGGWRGRLVAGASREVTDFRDLGTTIYDWLGRPIGARPRPGEIDGHARSERTSELGAFARATLERALGDAHRLRLAVAPTLTRRTGKDFLDPNPDGRDPIEARRELVQLVTGVEHELTARGGRLENIAFAKHYLQATDVEDARPGFTFVPIAATQHRFGVGDSARYRLSDHAIAKASYEWATRMPSAEELFGNGILVRQNLELVPETSHNVNLGVQLDRETAYGAWGGEVAAFARLADRLIVLLGNNLDQSYQNVHAARSLGLEGSAGWVAPGEWANVTANATYLDLRNASGEGTFGAFDGDRVPNRPWLFGSLDASVRRRGVVRSDDELVVFGSSRYVHAFFRGWPSIGDPASKHVIPSQLVHGLGVTYAVRGKAPVVATLELQNLTDARVFDSYGVQRPGRALYLKLSAEL